ncbi:SGNH/GDSL hydrolase family protein [Planococcus versutus]|uniref:Lysophospholipase n=1 Tax=Planococcus versutus TaxID=1302659 RepID=A0A1B1RYQ2_9BACL|nr:SGNH/GDSL hydrolase family protein [Planococcus versutus]ANU26056.1 lysophospholipase [Planococcus versutus]
MKKIWIAALTGFLLFSGSMAAQASVRIPAAYVAIGDSLAAGQTPKRQIDTGYADLIAQELMRNQPVAFYSKNLAFPGFTTEDVLESIQSDEAKEVLASANIITISAGANDLLRLVQNDPKQGSLTFQQRQVDFALNKARENMDLILAKLKENSPDATVYVIGYYFAYPHVRDNQKTGTAKQLDLLNKILKQSAEKVGAVFVSVDQSFGTDAVDKVPNPADVHPNLNGYQAMANAFFSEYQDAWTIQDNELPSLNPLSFEEIIAAQDQEDPKKPEDDKKAEETAARSSDQSLNGYLALRQAIPIS